MTTSVQELNSAPVVYAAAEDGPQVIIQRLAHGKITKEDARRSMQLQWDRAYEPSNFVRILRRLFGKDSSSRR